MKRTSFWCQGSSRTTWTPGYQIGDRHLRWLSLVCQTYIKCSSTQSSVFWLLWLLLGPLLLCIWWNDQWPQVRIWLVSYLEVGTYYVDSPLHKRPWWCYGRHLLSRYSLDISISLASVITSDKLLNFFLYCRLEVSGSDNLSYQRPSSSWMIFVDIFADYIKDVHSFILLYAPQVKQWEASFVEYVI